MKNREGRVKTLVGEPEISQEIMILGKGTI